MIIFRLPAIDPSSGCIEKTQPMVGAILYITSNPCFRLEITHSTISNTGLLVDNTQAVDLVPGMKSRTERWYVALYSALVSLICNRLIRTTDKLEMVSRVVDTEYEFIHLNSQKVASCLRSYEEAGEFAGCWGVGCDMGVIVSDVCIESLDFYGVEYSCDHAPVLPMFGVHTESRRVTRSMTRRQDIEVRNVSFESVSSQQSTAYPAPTLKELCDTVYLLFMCPDAIGSRGGERIDMRYHVHNTAPNDTYPYAKGLVTTVSVGLCVDYPMGLSESVSELVHSTRENIADVHQETMTNHLARLVNIASVALHQTSVLDVIRNGIAEFTTSTISKCGK